MIAPELTRLTVDLLPDAPVHLVVVERVPEEMPEHKKPGEDFCLERNAGKCTKCSSTGDLASWWYDLV